MKHSLKHGLMVAVGLLLSLPAMAQTPNSNYCGELRGRHYGPFDYRMRGQVDLEVVERAHFAPEVEAGIRGSTSYLGDDLNYTLRAIPNHVRALNTMAKVGLRDKVLHVPHALYPVECYFDRAMRFAPDDGAVRAVYGSYLLGLGRINDAVGAFAKALELKPDDPTINYNAGLAYFRKKDYKNARVHAKKAYELGFPLPGLKTMLTQAGQWDEPAK